jgi:lysine 6-dehydrogenase
MNVLILGSGMMGRAVAYDLVTNSHFSEILLADKDKESLKSAEAFLHNEHLNFLKIDVDNTTVVTKIFKDYDIVISAIPYQYNYNLAQIAIKTGVHFLDLGGNLDVVKKERSLFHEAKDADITIIPDCGLAPGLVSVITKDIVEKYQSIEFVKIRVGGLPVHPKPPLEYEIVFSLDGLINEYVEDAVVLDHGKLIQKASMTEIESISFDEPFSNMEAFITSGGSSTLPWTYKDKIKYLDYKTIRYPGHCQKFKTLLDIGFGSKEPIKLNHTTITPREVLIYQLQHSLIKSSNDVVLLKIIAQSGGSNDKIHLDYSMVDYNDDKTGFTAMMRTTGFPVSITADFLNTKTITNPGVFCPEEIIPVGQMFKELKKRNIEIKKTEKRIG